MLLVAVMGVLSPVASVAAALRVNTMAHLDVVNPVISYLPERTVSVGEEIVTPTITGGAVKLFHAGREIGSLGSTYTYNEVGQYEWRFYANDILFNTQKVTVTDKAHSMSLSSDMVTVIPNDLDSLVLPLPTSYRVKGETLEVDSIVKGDSSIHNGKYAVITDKENNKYTLTASVSLENVTFSASKIAFDKNGMTIDLSGNESTGNLKVAYRLYSEDGAKLYAVLPLNTIEIKNVEKSEVTFANIPTAPSVKNLAYYSKVNLTAPTVDSAKVGTTSFNVEAQTKIFKVQCSLYATEPSDWSKASDKIHTLTVEKNNDGQWVVKENGTVTDKYLEVDGLSVKIKALGWYRFQFETSTLFGYQLDETVDADNLNIEQDEAKSYVRYWSNSIHISSDTTSPNFAWVKPYSTNSDQINEMNENFSDLLNDYANYLPMTSKTDSKKVTVNKQQGLVLPAIFPHDNATAFDKMTVTNVSISQIEDENGDSVSNNYVRSGDTDSTNSFIYDKTNRLQISFVESDSDRGCENNNVKLLSRKGLYQITVTVREDEAKYADGKVGGYARTKTQSYYFYYDETFECDDDGKNSPVFDANNKFQISDVYLWEGSTIEFQKPNFNDDNTATDKIQKDYYLVGKTASANEVLSKLDASSGVLSLTVDLNDLYAYDENTNENTTNKLDINTLVATYDSFYIYAVARNFTAMQSNFKQELGVVLANGTYFDADYCIGSIDEDKVARYGYAWQRAEFNINQVADGADATINVTLNGSNEYKRGATIKIDSIQTNWGSSVVDGHMSVAVYQVKADNVLAPVNVVNSDDAVAAEVVSSVAFSRNIYTMENLYFTPGASGTYILVVTAKDNVSHKVESKVVEIVIGASNDWTATPFNLNTASVGSVTIDATTVVGEAIVLPNFKVGPNQEFVAKNREIFNDEDIKQGDYTITVLGVNDADCITGNKFTPNYAGQYTLRHSFYLTGESEPELVQDYVIQVNENTSASSDIRMGEDYDSQDVLWNVTHDANSADGKHKIGDQYYVIGEGDTGTNKKPAYAITLDQFVMSNYGDLTDFVVDSAFLFDYLEPIYEDGKISGYMYPAIAIPMANLVSENYSSDAVEVTVQKSGSSNYLVSSKKKNAGGKTDSASVIEQIDGYYVFRPEGKFPADCKTKYNANNYLGHAISTSGAVGVYTVTYKTQSAELSFNVTFGNLQNGTLSFEKDFLTYNNDDGKGSQEINSENTKDVVIEEIDGHRYVTIDMSKVSFDNNADMEALIANGPNPDDDNQGYDPEDYATAYIWENARVTVTFEGAAFIDASDWSADEDETQAIKITKDGKFMYKFDLSQGSGTYKVNISLPNKYTATSVSNSIEFTIDVDVTNRNHNLNNVWGIILIVLSVGLLAGVIYYFVKTARATRFIDAPRALKAKDKVKAPKKDAPKTETKKVEEPKVEAPKEDVK